MAAVAENTAQCPTDHGDGSIRGNPSLHQSAQNACHYTEAMEIGPMNGRDNSTGGFPFQAPLAKSSSLKHLSQGQVFTWLPLPTLV